MHHMAIVLQSSRSPLLAASIERSFEVVKILIEAGANVNYTDQVGIFIETFSHICKALSGSKHAIYD